MIYRYKPQYFEAFQKALARPEPFPGLAAWVRRARLLVLDTIKAAETQGLDEAARRGIVLHLDKRDISMQTILTTILHHAEREYPYLLGEQGRFNAVAVYATNLNDRHFVVQLLASGAVKAEPLHSSLNALRDHLESIPQE